MLQKCRKLCKFGGYVFVRSKIDFSYIINNSIIETDTLINNCKYCSNIL